MSLFYGAESTPLWLGGTAGDARLFALWYEDDRGVAKTDNRPAPVRETDAAAVRVTTFGGHLLQVFPSVYGPVDLLLWGALQTGDWGTLEHAARALALELGVQPALGALAPWVRIGFFRGSGDRDPADGAQTSGMSVAEPSRTRPSATGRPSGGARGLASIFDLSATVAPANWITLEAFGGVALEDDVIRTVYADAGAGRLAYLEVEIRR